MSKKISKKEMAALVENVNPRANLPRGFGLWSESMAVMWLRQNQKKAKEVSKRMSTTEVSIWSNTQAEREVKCPRCGAEPGVGCKQPSGKRYMTIHTERGALYMQTIGHEEWDRRHSRKPLDEVKDCTCPASGVNPFCPVHGPRQIHNIKWGSKSRTLSSSYVIQKDEKSFCPKCHQSVDLLCREDGTFAAVWFYICWDCQLVAHVGKGEVKRAGL